MYNRIMAIKEDFAQLLNLRIRVTGERDPLLSKLYSNRYQWLTLNNLKVSPRVLKEIVTQRKLVDNFTLRYDKNLAVIIPFRNREAHIEQLLPALKQKLIDEKIQHTIFVIEQADEQLFNKGQLMNAGVLIAGDEFDYYCFHDVDLLPQDCTYGYPSAPFRVFSNCISQQGLRRISNVCFGGIISLSREHFRLTNGFSNNFWHWGKEDDNFLLRLLMRGLTPMIDTKGSFTEIEESSDRHRPAIAGKNTADKQRGEAHTEKNRRYQYKVARGLIEPCAEGLSTVAYEMIETNVNALYTHVRIRLEK